MKIARSHIVALTGGSMAMVFLLAVAPGCAPRDAEKPAVHAASVSDPLFVARVAALAFRPRGVTAQLAFLVSLAVSTRARGVGSVGRRGPVVLIVGAWGGDTTMAQLAGGTGLRGFARDGDPGGDLLHLAGVDAARFVRTRDLTPPPDGRARIWIVTPAGVRLREEGVRTLLEADRRASPFLHEARLFTEKSLGSLLEFEALTDETLESLGVVREHTAAKLAAELGIDYGKLN
jgi:hypothetical protein